MKLLDGWLVVKCDDQVPYLLLFINAGDIGLRDGVRPLILGLFCRVRDELPADSSRWTVRESCIREVGLQAYSNSK